MLLLACATKDALSCGDGTHEVDGECVPDAGDTGDPSGESGTDSDADSDSNADTGDDDSGEDSPTDSGEETGESGDTGVPDVDHVVVGYFVEWGIYARGYEVAHIPADDLTHVNYAFANVSEGGECVVYDSWAAIERNGGNFAALVDLKAKHPHLKTLVSVGGWTLSSRFPAVAATAEGRETLARSCVDFMLTYGFDGLDIDWEYPVEGGKYPGTPEDRENYTLLLEAVRAELDARGTYLLTIAGPAGDDKIANLDVPGIVAAVDWINVMAYDFHGAWEPTTNHHAPLDASAASPEGTSDTYTVRYAMDAWQAAGAPPDKLVLGVPLYGRGWGGVGSADDGLFQPATSASPGTWEAGVLDYSDLLANYVDRGGYTRYWSDEAQVPWLYSPGAGVFISYEDEASLAVKLDWLQGEGFRGVMTWELDADTADHALVHQMRAALP